MVQIAKDRRQPTFNGSNVVMLAPAGSNANEHLLTLGVRFARHMKAEGRTAKDFPDPDGEMLKAGSNLLANIPRSMREVWDLAHRRVKYGDLAASDLGSIVVMSYAADQLYPDRVLASTMTEAMEAGVAWATPVSWQKQADGTYRIGNDASHNDEQFNPSRAANAAAQVLLAA